MIMALVSLFVLAVMAPMFNQAVSLILNSTSSDSTSSMIAQFIFPALLISLLISIFGYASFARQTHEGYGY
jgi:hypothetical protein